MVATPRHVVIVFAVVCAMGSPLVAAATTSAPSEGALPVVAPFPKQLLGAGRDAAAREFLQRYYESIRTWSEIPAKQFRPVPGRGEQGYYGSPGHEENDIRPLGYAVVVNAFLSEANPPAGGLDPAGRARCREHAVAILHYLTSAHVTGGGRCVNGKRWGNQWQSAMWARAAGLGAWIIWDHLDPALQASVAKLLVHEADRFIDQPPKTGKKGDTGAEENAWNAHVTSLCANMMPAHPHARAWDESAKRYMYNSFSVAADEDDVRPGDDGRSVREWVSTVNANPDYTVENHGLVHIGYLKTTMAELVENAGQYVIAGRQPPAACLHHMPDAWKVLLRCMTPDGAPIYFGGNDWKGVHTQANDIVIHAMLNLLRGDSDAAYLEKTALGVIGRIQRQQGGYYGVRRDIEQGGFVASRMVTCYLAHAALGAGAEPVTAEEFNRHAGGVTYLEHAQAVLHRTPGKFASFTWGPKRMALAWPMTGWAVWPHYSSYLGRLNEEESDAKHARLERVRHELLPDGFTVCGTLIRCGGAVRQDFAFVSPPGDLTIYVERLRPLRPGGLTARETGIIGHNYPLGENERTLHGAQGATRVTALGGTPAAHEIETHWLNIGDRVGYVVCRQPGRRNVVGYHDFARGEGRVPELQEWLSLIGNPAGASAPDEDWACLVTFLNQASADTKSLSGKVHLEAAGDTATCALPGYTLNVNFGPEPAVKLMPRQTNEGRK